ncbi:DUF488 domain-containing protein [Arthrobacter sp. NPDC055138]
MNQGVSRRLFTFGHGTSTSDELTALLTRAGVQKVVDVRRFPGSRKHPEMGSDALAGWLRDAGVGYRWEEALGGRRRIPAGEPEPDGWWRVAAFRAYAAYTRTPEFAGGLARLLADAEATEVAIMCSESVWWRCHRRLIADVLVVLHNIDVVHLLPGGKESIHEPSAGARSDDGQLVWDSPEE